MTFADMLRLEAADGHFTTMVSDQFMVGQGPNGGYLSALIATAARTVETDLDRPLRSASFQFIGRLTPGQEAEVRVQELRRGGAMSAVDVTVSQNDRIAVTSRCLFLPTRPGPTMAENPPPVLPSPEEIGVCVHQVDTDSLRSRYDTRYAVGGFPPDEFDRAEVTGWIRPSSGEPIDANWLLAIADGWAPPSLIVRDNKAMATTLELQVLIRHTGFDPIDDFVLGRNISRTMAEGYIEQETDIWSRDGILLCQARQLGMLLPYSPEGLLDS
ncbi:MAG: acyl-CoA thioesterase [Candidatus Poriferisodalaceae bacterium]|jgi:acyl-CoA thioesterase